MISFDPVVTPFKWVHARKTHYYLISKQIILLSKRKQSRRGFTVWVHACALLNQRVQRNTVCSAENPIKKCNSGNSG